MVSAKQLKIAYSFIPKIIIFTFSENPANFYAMNAFIDGFTWGLLHFVDNSPLFQYFLLALLYPMI